MPAKPHCFSIAKYTFTIDDADIMRDHFLMLGTEKERELSPRLIALLDKVGYSYEKIREFFLESNDDLKRSLVLQVIVDGTRTPYFEGLPEKTKSEMLGFCRGMLR